MDVDCVNCGRPDAEQTALTLNGERTLTDVRLCKACLDAFQATDWIHVEKSPPLG